MVLSDNMRAWHIENTFPKFAASGALTASQADITPNDARALVDAKLIKQVKGEFRHAGPGRPARLYVLTISARAAMKRAAV